MFFLFGCASSVQLKIKHRFTTQDVDVFVNDVAFVTDPSMLYGEWKNKLSNDFNYRVEQADFIGLGKVLEVEGQENTENTDAKALFQVEQVWQGGSPENPLELKFRVDHSNFNLDPWIDGEKDFVLFARRGLNEEQTPTIRWILSPASENLMLRTQWLIQKRPDYKPNGNPSFQIHSR